eukprot:358530-Chlamydomonas_euryale.AAC.3
MAGADGGEGVHAFLIPTEDPHMSEYPPGCFARREWISRFTGTAGTAVVTTDKALLWTDGRYFLQAGKVGGPARPGRVGVGVGVLVGEWVGARVVTPRGLAGFQKLLAAGRGGGCARGPRPRVKCTGRVPIAVVWHQGNRKLMLPERTRNRNGLCCDGVAGAGKYAGLSGMRCLNPKRAVPKPQTCGA